MAEENIKRLATYLGTQKDVVGGWLYGSRVTGGVHAESDWDVAILFSNKVRDFPHLARVEKLREEVAGVLGVSSNRVQLVDIFHTSILLAFEIIQANTLLKGIESLEVALLESKIYSMYELDFLIARKVM